jgi:hypothetical protein
MADFGFDISWIGLEHGEYYLADRSNAGIDVIALKFIRTIEGDFQGIVINALTMGVDNTMASYPITDGSMPAMATARSK